MRVHRTPPADLLREIDPEIIENLRSASGFKSTVFEQHLQPVILRLAECVQTLPLSRDAFPEARGALQFGLLCGVLAFQLGDNTIFLPGHSPEARRVLDPQYRYSAFAATIASVLPIVECSVVVRIAGRRWSSLDQVSLHCALESADQQGCDVEWNPSPRRPSRLVAAMMAGRFFVPGQWAEFEESVIAALIDSILPVRAAIAIEPPLTRVVRVSQDKVLEADARARSTRVAEAGAALLPLSALLAQPEQPAGLQGGQPPASGPAPVAAATSAPAAASSESVDPPKAAADAAPEAPDVPLPPAIDELVRAIRADQSFSKIIDDCVTLPSGEVRFPRKAMARYGMTAQAFLDMLRTANLVTATETSHVTLGPRFARALLQHE